MLERLSVRGLGIIDAVELEFPDGFAALTGETGAGKSLLVESLKLLCGQRAQSDMVRTGDDRLRVEGVFLDDGRTTGSGSCSRSSALPEATPSFCAGRSARRGAVDAGSTMCPSPPVLCSGLRRILWPSTANTSSTVWRTAARSGAWWTILQATTISLGRSARYSDVAGGRRRALSPPAGQTSRRDRLDTISYQVQEIDAADPHENEDEELAQPASGRAARGEDRRTLDRLCSAVSATVRRRSSTVSPGLNETSPRLRNAVCPCRTGRPVLPRRGYRSKMSFGRFRV